MPILLDIDGVAIDCPAKLNLTLGVGAPRADGLHPIASVMVVIDFGDSLCLNPLDDGPSRFVREWDPQKFNLEHQPGEPAIRPIDWPIEQDLIYRAHALMEQAAGHSLPIECGLSKRIPAGAGLGGGSSNAAGMLVGLREVFDLSLTDDKLLGLAQQLGADVVFAVHALLGQRAALVTGIGEVIEPLDALPGFDVVLVFPDGACPTGQVYEAFDETLPTNEQHDLASLAEQWRHAESPPEPHNDLTVAAARVCPAIATATDVLAKLGHAARLTGSGSALFVLANSPEHAERIADQACAAGLAATATRYTPGCSPTP